MLVSPSTPRASGVAAATATATGLSRTRRAAVVEHPRTSLSAVAFQRPRISLSLFLLTVSYPFSLERKPVCSAWLSCCESLVCSPKLSGALTSYAEGSESSTLSNQKRSGACMRAVPLPVQRWRAAPILIINLSVWENPFWQIQNHCKF